MLNIYKYPPKSPQKTNQSAKIPNKFKALILLKIYHKHATIHSYSIKSIIDLWIAKSKLNHKIVQAVDIIVASQSLSHQSLFYRMKIMARMQMILEEEKYIIRNCQQKHQQKTQMIGMKESRNLCERCKGELQVESAMENLKELESQENKPEQENMRESQNEQIAESDSQQLFDQSLVKLEKRVNLLGLQTLVVILRRMINTRLAFLIGACNKKDE